MPDSLDPRAPFGRVLTAMVTPFTADGAAVDVTAAAQLAVDLVDLGCDGLVVNGTTGESATTSDDEKSALTRTVLEAVGDRAHVVAGVGTNDTEHSIRLARQAMSDGAHGLLAVTPYYNKPPQAGLIAHFRAIADATELPVMLYDIPGRAGIAIEPSTMRQLAEHDRIVANKDAKGDLWAAQTVMAETDLAWYSGDDALNLPLLSVGAVGVVSVTGHVVADRLRDLVIAHEEGRVKDVLDINRALVPVTRGIMTRTQGVIMVKAALDLLGRAGGGSLRLPQVAADDAQREQLRIDLRDGGFSL